MPDRDQTSSESESCEDVHNDWEEHDRPMFSIDEDIELIKSQYDHV